MNAVTTTVSFTNLKFPILKKASTMMTTKKKKKKKRTLTAKRMKKKWFPVGDSKESRGVRW